MITTDICVIGAGPVGLFSVFEAGLLKMRCHLVDVLPAIGGQLSEIYPKNRFTIFQVIRKSKQKNLLRTFVNRSCHSNRHLHWGTR